MADHREFWKTWWDDHARQSGHDYTCNRVTSVRLKALEDKTRRHLLDSISCHKGSTVLDAGCGSGENLLLLSPLVKHVVGVDYSTEMLARAQARVSESGHPNISLDRADITQLKFPDNTFDSVICASVLQYLDELQCAQSIRELARVCKPGGTIVLHIKNGMSLYGISLGFSRSISHLLGRRTKPEFYRSLSWHRRTLHSAGCELGDITGFGIFTFVPLPALALSLLLRLELSLPFQQLLTSFAVNCQLAVRVHKQAT